VYTRMQPSFWLHMCISVHNYLAMFVATYQCIYLLSCILYLTRICMMYLPVELCLYPHTSPVVYESMYLPCNLG